MAKKDEKNKDEVVDYDAGVTEQADADDDQVLVGQAKVDDKRDPAEIGAPGEDARMVAEALVEVDKDGVPRARGDHNAMLTGVNSDIVNPAFGGPLPPDQDKQ